MESGRKGGWQTLVVAILIAWVLSVATAILVLRLPMPTRIGTVATRMLIVGDGPGEGKILVTARPDGSPSVLLYDVSGRSVAEMSATPTGVPRIVLNAPGGGPLLRLEVTGAGLPRVRLSDPATGKPAWSVTLDANGTPVVESVPANPE